MNTQRRLASCAVLVLLAAVDGAAAQQPRAGQQERSVQPKPPPKTVGTTLFEQTGVPYQVEHFLQNEREACAVIMDDDAAQISFWIQTEADGRSSVIVVGRMLPRPTPFSRDGTRQTLRIEVDDVAQSYTIEALRDSSGAFADVPRAAVRHLRAAIDSRSGFQIKVGASAPLWFRVPPRAASVFYDCARSISRGRPDGATDRLNPMLAPIPSR